MIDRRERMWFLVAAAIGFVYVILRAALVPFIHDEARSFQLYVITGDFLPFGSHWDAGNHLLSSALAQISHSLLGPGPFALRSFSVLAYALYAWYVFRMGGWFAERRVRWCIWLALLFTPFAIEFFALFRGYGLAYAFQVMALYHLVRFLREGGMIQLLSCLGALALATSASLSMLLQACMIMGLVALFMPMRARAMRGGWLAGSLAGALPLAFLITYAMGLSERGLLYYGKQEGLIKDTLGTLLREVGGITSHGLMALMAVAVLALAWPALQVLARRAFDPGGTALAVCVSLLLGELAGRAILGAAFDVPYPTDRTAMHLVPLFLLASALTLDRMTGRDRRWRWAAIILLCLPVRTLLTANIDRTTSWSAEAIPAEVFDIVEAEQRTLDRPVMIAGYNQNSAVWDHGNFLRGNGMNFMDDAGFPQPQCDLMIIDPTFFERPAGFRTLFSASTGHLQLLERREPLRTAPLFDTSFVRPSSTDEFLALWSPDVKRYLGKELLIEIDAVITSTEEPLTAQLVIEVRDTTGAHLHYKGIGLERMRSTWHADTLHVMLRVPRIAPEAGTFGAYFWNLHRQEMTLEHARLKILEIVPGNSGMAPSARRTP